MSQREQSQVALSIEEEKTKKLAARYHVPYIDLASLPLNRKLIQSFPVDFLHRLNFIPVEEYDHTVKIAMADPSDLAAVDVIESSLGRKVDVYAASRSAIHEAFRRSETASQVLKEATEGYVTRIIEKEERGDEENISVEALVDQDGSIIKLVNSIIFAAVQKRASDVHVETRDDLGISFSRLFTPIMSSMSLADSSI